MHVFYFHQHFSTPSGAAGTRSYEMARMLLRNGHEVTMVCGGYGVGDTGLTGAFVNGRRVGRVDGIFVVELQLPYSNSDAFVSRALKFLKFAAASSRLALAQDYEVIFCTTTPLTAGIPGVLARWLRRKRFVFEVRDLWPELPRQMGIIRNPVVLALMSALEWVSYRSADKCIALSPGILDGIARRGVHRKSIALIPNGCDFEIFQSSKARPWRPNGCEDSDLLAVFCGTHGIANGLDAVLSAASVLKRRGRNHIRIVLVGDGKLKPALQARAAYEGLSNVIFLDPIGKRSLAGLLAAADLGIQCLANVPAFYYGTSPNKFFDYIAAGLPVITNYPGWLADLIAEYECGLPVGPDDPSAFADAFEQAAADRSRLKTMGKNAGRLAHERFDRRNLAAQWVDWVTH